MGRQTKLTPERAQQLLTLIGNHALIEDAAHAVRIHPATFHAWMAKGAKATAGVYREFHDAIKAAQALSTISLVDAIRKDPSWQAKAWILERRDPKRFGRKIIQVEASGPEGAPIPVDGSNMGAVIIVCETAAAAEEGEQ